MAIKTQRDKKVNKISQAKFLYVQGDKAKDKMISLGYRLIQKNEVSDIYVFENDKDILQFSKDVDFEYIPHDTLFI